MLTWQDRLRSIVTHPLLPVFLVCLLSFSLRIYRLEVPETWYFDEVYHGFTAVEMADGNRDVYDPWAAPPPNVAYEWVHPPLAKLIMAGSVWIFGAESWAWRLPSAIFGTAVIGLTGTLAWIWWGNARLALLASSILALDGLVLVMSRLAMNDVFFLSFLLLSLIAYSLSWKKQRWYIWVGVAAVSLGAALASKWTTLYILPLFGLDTIMRLWQDHQAHLRDKKKSILRLFWIGIIFAVAVPALYLLSHTQYFVWGYTWSEFIMLQKQIWWYHTQLVATHPYQSTPWQWILDLRPVWFYSGSTALESRNIYALANPVFLWSGLVATGILTYKTWLSRPLDWASARVILAYVSLWLPWVISPRIMFFYHYLPALPFLAIILAKVMTDFENISPDKTPRRTQAITIWFCLAALWLIVFYPHLTGLPVSLSWASEVYYFIPSWR